MPTNDSFYIEDDVLELIQTNTKKRGDKSKIVNEAVRHYFKPPIKEVKPSELKRILVEL